MSESSQPGRCTVSYFAEEEEQAYHLRDNLHEMFQEAADIHFMIKNMQLYRPPLFVLQSFCQIVEPAAEMCSKQKPVIL